MNFSLSKPLIHHAQIPLLFCSHPLSKIGLLYPKTAASRPPMKTARGLELRKRELNQNRKGAKWPLLIKTYTKPTLNQYKTRNDSSLTFSTKRITLPIAKNITS